MVLTQIEFWFWLNLYSNLNFSFDSILNFSFDSILTQNFNLALTQIWLKLNFGLTQSWLKFEFLFWLNHDSILTQNRILVLTQSWLKFEFWFWLKIKFWFWLNWYLFFATNRRIYCISIRHISHFLVLNISLESSVTPLKFCPSPVVKRGCGIRPAPGFPALVPSSPLAKLARARPPNYKKNLLFTKHY